MATPLNQNKGHQGHSGDAVRYGLAISGALALLAVIGVLAFGGPF